MSPLTLTILIVLAVFLVGLFLLAKEFGEFERVFVYGTWFAMLFIIGAAAYLSYANPTFAEKSAFATSGTTVRTDESNLLRE